MVYRLDLGQISFKLVENVFATRQHAFLATSNAFYDVLTRAYFGRDSDLRQEPITRSPADELLPTSLGFSIFGCFFRPSFFSLSFLFAAVIDLLLGLLVVKKTAKKASSNRAIFTMEQPGVVAGNFALSFSLNFLSIFVHISGSIRLITLIWASLERSLPPAEVEYR